MIIATGTRSNIVHAYTELVSNSGYNSLCGRTPVKPPREGLRRQVSCPRCRMLLDKFDAHDKKHPQPA